MADGTSIEELIRRVNPDEAGLSVRVRPREPDDEGGRQVRICVEGELDVLTAGRLRHEVDHVVDDGARAVHLELAGVGFCDGAGLRVLLWGAERVHAVGGTLVVHDPCWSLRYLLDLLDLDTSLRPREGTRPGPPEGRADAAGAVSP